MKIRHAILLFPILIFLGMIVRARFFFPVTVVVAKERLVQWSVLREPEKYFETKEVSAVKAPKNYIAGHSLESLKYLRLKANIDVGAILTEDHLIAGLRERPDTGKRAMEINIAVERAVGVSVMPGSRVDIIQTVGDVATVLLENVLVLAIDLNASAVEDKIRIVAGTVTVQFDATEQAKVSAARQEGTLSLVLRQPPGDGPMKGNN